MKKFMMLFSVFLLVFGITGAAGALTITYDYSIAPDTTLTTPVGPAGATVETFDSPLLWTWTGDYAVVSGSSSGQYAAPYNNSLMPAADPTYYVTVPDPPTAGGNGSVTVTNLGGSYNYFGLFWGSVDTYNTLTFYNGMTQVASFTGSDAINPSDANGNQTAPSTNLYVNFFFDPGDEFDSFVMASSQFAFEADNIAVGTVPEPATMLLLGTGLVGLAALGRKKFFKK